MTFAAVGSFLQATTGAPATSLNITLNNQGIGDLILMAVRSTTNGIVPSSITGGGATWSQIGTTFTGTTNAGVWAIFQGVVTATGAQTATANLTGGSANIRCDGGEFSSTVGSWALDVQTHLDGAGVSTWPSITPAGAGELYFGSSQDSGAASAGATSGYTYNIDANSNGTAWNAACTGAAQAPVWGDAGHIFGVMILVQETGSAAPVVVTPAQPGRTWRQKFQHPQQLLQVPSGVQTIIGTASAAGDAEVSTAVTEIPFATVAGAGAATSSITQGSGGTSGGAGAVSTLVTQLAPGTSAGLGAVTDVATEIAKASAAGAAAVSTTLAEIAGAAAAGAAAVTDVVTQIVIASAAGAGAVNANSGANQNGIAAVAGAAVATAFATVIVPATAAGAATVTANAIQLAGAAAAGAGVVSDKATQAVTGTATAAASVTASSTTPSAFTIGTLTATTAFLSTLTAAGAASALTATVAPGATLTATDQRTGGPS